MYSYSARRVPKFGEIYIVHFDGTGCVQKGTRPALVFQNNIGNSHSPNVMVLPLTSVNKKPMQPTHVLIPAQETGLARDSVVLCENQQCIPMYQLGKFITALPDKYMEQVAEASLLASSAICCINKDKLIEIWQKAARLNYEIPA